ncbi:MAG: aldo/keto reductase [Fusobacteriales bacterium]|jgi:diketogulonate reductase-like aldo/keto reductase|nr:aldo/keto reductase [Fusobacteriales bacterium]
MSNTLKYKVKLNNGVEIPEFGLGVFKVSDDEAGENVKNAIINGYRLIDTAQIYGNEEGTGRGIKAGLEAAGLKREDIFVTSKVWNNHISYDETITAFYESLNRLDLDYLDLYLIHWPGNHAFEESWKALEFLYKEGKIRAIGVSNFNKSHLEELFSFATITPVLNQIEYHPKLTQGDLIDFCKKHDILVQAWSPLMQGQILTNETILKIAEAHNRNAAQIVLRWGLQNNILLVSKSVKTERIISNAKLDDFSLTKEEMDTISNLNEDYRVGPNPDTFDFI